MNAAQQKKVCGQVNSGTPCDLMRSGNERVCPDCNPRTSAQIQQEREASDLANHKERLIWLESDQPRWSCGTLVDTHTRNVLTEQSRAYIARATGSAA